MHIKHNNFITSSKVTKFFPLGSILIFSLLLILKVSFAQESMPFSQATINALGSSPSGNGNNSPSGTGNSNNIGSSPYGTGNGSTGSSFNSAGSSVGRGNSDSNGNANGFSNPYGTGNNNWSGANTAGSSNNNISYSCPIYKCPSAQILTVNADGIVKCVKKNTNASSAPLACRFGQDSVTGICRTINGRCDFINICGKKVPGTFQGNDNGIFCGPADRTTANNSCSWSSQ